MKKWYVDLNCDVGEGIGNEAQLFPHISSCNIACGGHAGESSSIFEIIGLAKRHTVKIGAHPSYPDKLNFGRKVMDISKDALRNSLSEQLSMFGKIAKQQEIPVNHIKPHGALYNQIAKDAELAKLFLEVVNESDLTKKIYALSGSQVALLAKTFKIEVCCEAFADRNYNSDGTLVPRTHKDALISKPGKVLQHVLPMIQNREIRTLSGETLRIQVDTICVHGDTPSALQILQYLSKELPKHNIVLSK
ncbi:5-oxoprolinase subunit PxpA [Flagellimonas sp. S174]|uniref:5-oxoprolinase subunit PxpA n=1 Tax=Flagellimonas sp. S174 TaxID=3410790 RepID=UPI003BF61589